jgi:hypothetical protein
MEPNKAPQISIRRMGVINQLVVCSVNEAQPERFRGLFSADVTVALSSQGEKDTAAMKWAPSGRASENPYTS